MTQMQICSGCDNLVEIGEQYCQECKNDIAQGDWEEMQQPDWAELEADLERQQWEDNEYGLGDGCG